MSNNQILKEIIKLSDKMRGNYPLNKEKFNAKILKLGHEAARVLNSKTKKDIS